MKIKSFLRKKVLSLVLCVAVMLSVMVLGAGAAFSDQADIENTEAVEMATALKIISGYEDGSYHPERNIKRSEMCKMICIALNGGKEPATSTKDDPTFSDIDGHWAEGYIEYCYAQGVVSGVGGGRFNPDGNVTVTQAAKMLLVALGYNADVEQFNGANWSLYVNVKANQDGIYEDLETIDTAAALNRDQAAQMVWNTMQAVIIVKTSTIDVTTGEVTEHYTKHDKDHTLLMEKYDGDVAIGFLTGFDYDANKGVWTYTFDSDDNYGVKLSVNNPIGSQTLKSSEDYTDLFGQRVKVAWKTTVSDEVYGVFSDDSAVLATGYNGDLPETIDATDDSIDFAGTTYKLDDAANATPTFLYNTDTASGNLTALSCDDAGLYAVTLVDNNGNGKVDAILTMPLSLAEVTYVGADSATFAALSGFGAIGTKDFEDVAIYDGVAQDDYVLVTGGAYASTRMMTFEKLELQTGTINGTKDGNKFLVDDVWMTNTTGTTLDAGDSIEYLALGNKIYYADVVEAGEFSKALGMIYNVGITVQSGVTGKAVEASMIFADGTKKTVIIDKVNGADVTGAKVPASVASTDYITDAGVAVNGGTIAGGTKTLSDLLIGELVNYKINNDGNYEVWNLTHDGNAYAAPSNGDVLGYDGISVKGATYDPASKTINDNGAAADYELADDAVVFFYQGTANTAASTNEAYVYTGKQIKDSQVTGTGSFNDYGTALYGKSNGFTYAQVAVLGAATEPGILSGAAYGYLLADSYTRYEGGKTYAYFTYWNGSESVDARAESYDANKYKAGAIVTFDVVSAATDTERQLVKDLKAPSALSIGQVDGWDKVSKIGLDTNREITDDTVIFYIDSQKGTAQEGNIGMIRDASDVTGDGVKENNVYYIPVGTKDIALLVVDINNNMKLIPAAYNGTMASATDLTNALAAGWSEITVGADLTSATATVGAGQTVKVTSDQTDLNLTVEKGGAVDISAALATGSLTNNGIDVTLEAGATLVTDNVTLFGDYLDVTSGTANVKNTAGGHIVVTVTGTVTVNKDLVVGSGDTVTLTSGQLIGATAGIKLTLRPASVVPGASYDNYYNNDGTSTSASTLVDSSGHSVGNGNTYVWGTIYTNNSGATSLGWVKQ